MYHLPPPSAPTAHAHFWLAAGKFVPLCILANISHGDAASFWERVVLVVLLVTETVQAVWSWPSQSLSTTELSCRGSGVSSSWSWMEFLSLDVAYWPNHGRDCSKWRPYFNKRTIFISELDLSVTTITMSDQNYYWTVLPSYKTSFVTGAMMKRSKG